MRRSGAPRRIVYALYCLSLYLKGTIMKTLSHGIMLGLCALLAGCGGSAPISGPASTTSESPGQTVLFYLHRTIRCHECLTMEKLTGELMESSLADVVAEGRLEYVSGNLDEPEYEPYFDLFDLSFSTLVLADLDGDGNLTHWKKLDAAWDKADDETAFRSYVLQEVSAWLNR